MRKVAVFFGGKSCEREISILTGAFVLNVLAGAEFDLLPVYVHTDGGTYTSPSMTNLDVFKEKDLSKFERIFLDGGSVYALNTKKAEDKEACKNRRCYQLLSRWLGGRGRCFRACGVEQYSARITKLNAVGRVYG